MPGGERLVPIDQLAASHDDRLELASRLSDHEDMSISAAEIDTIT